MKPIEEVYDAAECDGWGDYQPMIDSMCDEVVAMVELGDYQGDTIAVIRDGTRYGFLTFGWGSCSGCDALQACDTLAEVSDLRQQIYDQIVWHDSKGEMRAFLATRDWKTQYYFDASDTEVAEFVDKALAALA